MAWFFDILGRAKRWSAGRRPVPSLQLLARRLLALQGRHVEARALFEGLLTLRNDVGLLAEGYDPRSGRQLGNFPQAFSRLAIANGVRNWTLGKCPAKERGAS